jgi:hypothetical protein
MNILEAVVSFIIMTGMGLAGLGLGRRVRGLVNHTPGHLLPWIYISIFTTAYRFLSHLLGLFSSYLWGLIDKSALWYVLNRFIFLLIDVNCGEIIPMITFVFSSKVCIGFLKSTNSTLDSSDTSSVDFGKKNRLMIVSNRL